MDLFEKYYTLSLKYLQMRQRSEKEIVAYLMKKSAKGGSASGGKKTPDDTILRVLAKLKENKFLDDGLFAKMWIEGRTRAKPRSKWLLTRELKEKGVSEEIIENIFLATTEMKSDLSLAKEAIGKRILKHREHPRTEIYQKIGGFLARRGFDWETSKRAIDDLLKERYNNSE
ncbi:MAG: regulatory protein RecX [bacterium]|nr:regulatory protein RecX [bacterium]